MNEDLSARPRCHPSVLLDSPPGVLSTKTRSHELENPLGMCYLIMKTLLLLIYIYTKSKVFWWRKSLSSL